MLDLLFASVKLFSVFVRIGDLGSGAVTALALGVGLVLKEGLLDLALEHVDDPLGQGVHLSGLGVEPARVENLATSFMQIGTPGKSS